MGSGFVGFHLGTQLENRERCGHLNEPFCLLFLSRREAAFAALLIEQELQSRIQRLRKAQAREFRWHWNCKLDGPAHF